MSNSTREKLVNQRKSRNIKQKDVANFIGITPTALSRYENGETELRMCHIEKYAEFLGFEIKLLLK